jgi:hypothetical protein
MTYRCPWAWCGTNAPGQDLCDRCELRQALADAIWAADYLAEQQAMPDDGYVERLERARAVLGS